MITLFRGRENAPEDDRTIASEIAGCASTGICVCSFRFARKPRPVVSTASRAGPFGVVVRLGLAVLRSRCAGFPALQSAWPLTLPLWTASERSFAFCPGSLTIRQRQCRHHFEPGGGPASDSDVLRQARTNHGAHVLPADRSSSPAAAAITSPTSSQFSSATLTIAADCPGWRSHSARAAFRWIGTDGH